MWNCSANFFPLFVKNVPAFTESANPCSFRCDEWKILWNVIRNHHEGICDVHCRELEEKQRNLRLRSNSLKWLKDKGYLSEIPHLSKVWKNPPTLYRLNWKTIRDIFGIGPPNDLIPLKSEKT
ncbi:MAG: hypothetical protein ACE5DL_05720 [Nitrosopumilaceae archaeon]